MRYKITHKPTSVYGLGFRFKSLKSSPHFRFNFLIGGLCFQLDIWKKNHG